MKISEIMPDSYLQTVIKKLGSTTKMGEPMPRNILPKGNIRTSQTKQAVQKTNDITQKNLIKPTGNILPIPVGPNKEKDMLVKPMGTDKVQIIDPKPGKGQNATVTVKKTDLNPVITNLMQRGKKN